jgi:CENP-B N-terminal DNA-binding domain
VTPPRKLRPDQELEAVHLYVSGMSCPQIGITLGVTPDIVERTLHRHGVTMRRGKLTPDQKVEVVAQYRAGQSMQQIAGQFGICQASVRGIIHRRKVETRGQIEAQRRRHGNTLREDAFDDLTCDAAYWAGFLFADGTVCPRSSRSHVVRVALAARDRGHLVKLREFLGSTHEIGEQANGSNPSCQFRMTSNRLALRLLSLGRYDGTPAPELTQSRHFWRGLVDGDGSIGILADGYATFGLVGPRRYLDPFLGFLAQHALAGRMKVHPDSSIYRVSTIGPLAAKIIQLLYEGQEPALDRKATTACRIFPLISGRPRVKRQVT